MQRLTTINKICSVLLFVTATACSSFNRSEFSGGEFRNHRKKGGTKEASSLLSWPVDGVRISRGFRNTGRKPHWGLDLGGAKGSKISVAHDGRVIYAGSSFRGYGRMVLVERSDGWATLYGHLNKILVREGEMLKRGDVVGEMGRTGNARGVHLHFEVRRNRIPVDPIGFLPPIGSELAHN